MFLLASGPLVNEGPDVTIVDLIIARRMAEIISSPKIYIGFVTEFLKKLE
jgi:hypothetical protein